MYRVNMLMVVCLVAAVLPWTFVDGKTGCWAGPTSPGTECLYGSEIPGGNEMQIRYYFTSRFSRICCQAYECTFWYCRFVDVGCGQSLTSEFETRSLDWERRDIEPIMRCYDSRGNGVYYSYRVIPFVSG